jgi:hypothetical protein
LKGEKAEDKRQTAQIMCWVKYENLHQAKMEGERMERGLVDLSGLSGDPESDDRAEKLLARWEEEIENSSDMGSVEYRQQLSIIPGNRRSRVRLFDRRVRRQSAGGSGVCSHAPHKKWKRR